MLRSLLRGQAAKVRGDCGGERYAEDALKRRLVALNDDERAQTFENIKE
jgi:hypothetical protein